MTRVITISDVKALIHKIGLESFFLRLIDRLESDYSRWEDFQKWPRHACYYPQGVIELMPVSDEEYYAFKYVNGHPENPKSGKLTVVAMGVFASALNGYPLLISEMTLLTALRTAATSALASKHLARKEGKRFGIIGTGSQSEFQTLAHAFALGCTEIRYFDTDPAAMEKFAHNLRPFHLELIPCESAKKVIKESDIVTTATAAHGHAKIIEGEWVRPGTHINGVGGDSPGKTEMDPEFAKKCKIVIEHLPQTIEEGEIQQIGTEFVYAELWELAAKRKKGRESDQEITLFDSVGFALEDYSALRLVRELSETYNLGHKLDMIPETLANPKNLFSLLHEAL